MLGILDHHVEGVERLLARESPYLSAGNIGFGARDCGADGRQKSGLVYAGDFYFHRTGGLSTLFFPIHFDLPMRIAFEYRRATHCMNGNTPPTSDETDDLLSRQRVA